MLRCQLHFRSSQEAVDYIGGAAQYLRSEANSDESASIESLLIRRDLGFSLPLSNLGFDPAWVYKEPYPDPNIAPVQ